MATYLQGRTPAQAPLAPSPCSPAGETLRSNLRAKAEAQPPPTLRRTEDATGAPLVSAVVVSHERPELLLGALHSLVYDTSVPIEVVVVENGSDARTRTVLGEAHAAHRDIRVHQSEHNLGCVGGRRLGMSLVDSEFVLFLDDDAELMPGALEHLLADLEAHPEAGAVCATVVIPDGRVSYSGGFLSESKEIANFVLGYSGLQYDDSSIPPSGPCDWIPGGACLVRSSLVAEFPPDPEMLAYYEDAEWCYRVSRSRQGCFRRSREALVLHHAQQRPWGGRNLAARTQMVGPIAAAACFYRRHGVLLASRGVDLFAMMPELVGPDGTADIAAAHLIMELADTHSTDWMLEQWMAGALDPVIGIERAALTVERDACREELGRLADERRSVGAELDQARAELDEARAELERARLAGVVAQAERDRALSSLERIYASRLWRLGGLGDRTRRTALGLVRRG